VSRWRRLPALLAREAAEAAGSANDSLHAALHEMMLDVAELRAAAEAEAAAGGEGGEGDEGGGWVRLLVRGAVVERSRSETKARKS
jgi:hypothetical protein